MKKFNAKIGRMVTYNMDPFSGKYTIIAINQDGTLNLKQGNFTILNVNIRDVIR